MSTLVENVSKRPIGPHVKSLIFELMANDEEGEDVEVRPVEISVLCSTLSVLLTPDAWLSSPDIVQVPYALVHIR